LHPIGIGRVVLGATALESLEEVVGAGAGRRVALVADATPMLRGPDDLKEEVAARLADSDTRTIILGGDTGYVVADPVTVTSVAQRVPPDATLVSVGSGTITDIAKAAAREAGAERHVAVQTAASVNGYSDDLSVLLLRGAKRTVQSRWPDALLIDIPTLSSAPRLMTAAGFGDACATFTASADWYLASVLGVEMAYSETLVALARGYGERLLTLASGIGAAEPAPEALEQLAWILTLSGLAMGAAGRTAPGSGTEHAISHLFDMAALSERRPPSLHGIQVGLGSVLSSIVWVRFTDRITRGDFDFTVPPDPAATGRQVESAFGRLDPTGAVVEECQAAYDRKLTHWERMRDRLGDAVVRWGEHAERLSALLVGPDALVDALTSAGLPLGPLDRHAVRWALANCHLMRDRVGVVDAAALLGTWTEDEIDAVLDEAQTLGCRLE